MVIDFETAKRWVFTPAPPGISTEMQSTSGFRAMKIESDRNGERAEPRALALTA